VSVSRLPVGEIAILVATLAAAGVVHGGTLAVFSWEAAAGLRFPKDRVEALHSKVGPLLQDSNQPCAK
jgi:hypothetical protein